MAWIYLQSNQECLHFDFNFPFSFLPPLCEERVEGRLERSREWRGRTKTLNGKDSSRRTGLTISEILLCTQIFRATTPGKAGLTPSFPRPYPFPTLPAPLKRSPSPGTQRSNSTSVCYLLFFLLLRKGFSSEDTCWFWISPQLPLWFLRTQLFWAHSFHIINHMFGNDSPIYSSDPGTTLKSLLWPSSTCLGTNISTLPFSNIKLLFQRCSRVHLWSYHRITRSTGVFVPRYLISISNWG